MVSYLPVAAAGILMDREIEWLTKVTRNPERPCVSLLGGAKGLGQDRGDRKSEPRGRSPSDRRSHGVHVPKSPRQPTGRSLVEPDKVDLAKRLLDSTGSKILLPVDHVVVREVKPGAPSEVVGGIGPDQIGVDIGPATFSAIFRVA